MQPKVYQRVSVTYALMLLGNSRLNASFTRRFPFAPRIHRNARGLEAFLNQSPSVLFALQGHGTVFLEGAQSDGLQTLVRRCVEQLCLRLLYGHELHDDLLARKRSNSAVKARFCSVRDM